MKMQSPNVLISAYACRPNQGSEPGVGWNTVKELVKSQSIWVLTRNNNRSDIETYLNYNPIANLHVIYCDVPFWAQWLRTDNLIRYYLWQIQAYFTARKLLQDIPFDVIHHITYVRYSTPSFLALLPVPFIWGPVGGGESAPQPFWRDFGLKARIYEMLRAFVRWLGEQDPFVHLTIQHSFIVQATTEDTAKRLNCLGCDIVEISSESGLSEEELTALDRCVPVDQLSVRFISMARLLHWKGIHLGLRAFAQANLPEASEYWILGEGPEKAKLLDLAEFLGIGNRVKFLGRLPREQTLKRLGESIALVHASLHDSGGWVCLEAMAAGRPVICLNLGGPGVQVTEKTGFKIPAQTPEQVVQDMAIAMRTLAEDKELRLRMGQAGQQHVRERYSWTVRGQELRQLYQKVLGESKYLSAPDSAPS